MRHPTTATWKFPPPDRAAIDARRCNLRSLAARPERFEHHLTVVGQVGDAQLEIATASEPLYFAHQNISDEYALPLTTGDPMIDAFPVRTFLSRTDDGSDVGRIRQRAGQLVLHPLGLLHWTGRLRPPFVMPSIPGPRRCGLSLVLCASAPRPVSAARPLWVSAGLEAEVKAYGDTPVPFLLADLSRDAAATVAVVGNARMDLLVSPADVGGEHGGYLLLLESDTGFSGDLIYLQPGQRLNADCRRGLWLHADVDATPPPVSWDAAPSPPWPCFEDAARVALPLCVGELRVEARDEQRVAVRVGSGEAAEVPRYWLARMLFRLGLHGFALGYLETYGGFFYDDRDGYHLGIRGGGSLPFDRAGIEHAVEQLYRAVAPEGYSERLS